jgi:ABC-type bacteriocin/lantibiotic exporter with double-glycine peptidase domain
MNSESIRQGLLVSKAAVAVTVFFAAIFVVLVWDSNWWWFDTGFYASLISSGINLWIYRQLGAPLAS